MKTHILDLLEWTQLVLAEPHEYTAEERQHIIDDIQDILDAENNELTLES